ncbi:homeobox protein dbx [Culex quinquefasciatus]|uniref:Homeobox protein dbx n=1 Tax=Culex quinquefasciatus TaxID=7176 RepID=B0X8Z2_CULQU|nr:homeobox protein dbx [Culex quinquefasciatus]|eukprot:XP_001866114.1 homeobox protein dbx [Culex quinquefasciatus]
MNGASPAANNNNNNNNGSSNSSSGSNCNGNNSCSNTTSEAGSLPNSPDLQDDGTRLQQQQSSAQQPQQQQQQQQPRDNKIIAKPLPSRPMPFLQHGLNHPHLHSLLAHCRNPYLPDSQRKGLEKRFQLQKYISKPDRKKLAERLGLKDSQILFIPAKDNEKNCSQFSVEKRNKPQFQFISPIQIV